MTNARQLLDAHIHHLQHDFAAWRELFAVDATMEFAYGRSAGVDTPLHDIEAIAASVKGFLDAVSDFTITDAEIYPIEGQDAVIAEFTGTATVVATGRHYRQNYVVYLRAAGGKIVFFREYFDASRIIAAFGTYTAAESGLAAHEWNCGTVDLVEKIRSLSSTYEPGRENAPSVCRPHRGPHTG